MRKSMILPVLLLVFTVGAFGGWQANDVLSVPPIEGFAVRAGYSMVDAVATAERAEWKREHAELTATADVAIAAQERAEALRLTAEAESAEALVRMAETAEKAYREVESHMGRSAALQVALSSAQGGLTEALSNRDIPAAIEISDSLLVATAARIESQDQIIEQQRVVILTKDEKISAITSVVEAQEIEIIAWQVRWSETDSLRISAEGRVAAVDDGRFDFDFGVGALAGLVQPLGGSLALGTGYGFTATLTLF